MPKTESKKEGILRARCDSRLEEETIDCADKSKMDFSEYIRAAVREKNERVNAK